MNIVRKSSFRTSPWKNGGGTTFEALRVPDAGEAFRWRVSVAEVASSGPFSDFSGYRRQMVLLRGAGVRLRFGAARETVLRAVGDRVEFDGAEPTQCELLAGPCTDLNLIVADGIDCTEAQVQSLAAPFVWAADLSEVQLLFVIAGGVELADAEGAKARLDPWDLAWRRPGNPPLAGLAPLSSPEHAMVFLARFVDA